MNRELLVQYFDDFASTFDETEYARQYFLKLKKNLEEINTVKRYKDFLSTVSKYAALRDYYEYDDIQIEKWRIIYYEMMKQLKELEFADDSMVIE